MAIKMKLLEKLRYYNSIVFSKSQNITTTEDRSKERARRIAQTAMAAMCSRFFNIATGLITVPLMLPYLGVEQFGIWMALTGFVAFLAFTDLGLSIGLQNKLTECYGKDDLVEPSYFISSTLFIITILAILLVLFAQEVIPVVGVINIIPTSNEIEGVLIKTTQFVIYTFALGLFSSVIQRIFESSQDGLYANILLALGRILSLVSVFVCVYLEADLPIIVALFMGCPFVIMIIGGGVLFYKRPWLIPYFSKIRVKTIKQLIKIGTLSLSAQIGASIMSTGPLLVLTSKYGVVAIVPFTLCQRLYGVVGMLLSVALGPLWPAYGEAKERNDWNWINSTLHKSIKLSIFIVAPAFSLMLVFGQDIIAIWSRDITVTPDIELLTICGLWMALLAGIRLSSMYLNGLGLFKGQASYGLIFPIISVCLGLYFSDFISFNYTLLLMIVAGELTRLLSMKVEIKRVIKKEGL
jgi:O-antigen/teichoic acid export membrane protein